jgi:hypothetical protein
VERTSMGSAGETAAAAAAAEALAAVELEQAESQRSWLGHAVEAVQAPVMLLLQATIPLVEVNSYDRTWFLRSLAASPLFIAVYLELWSWQAMLIAAAAGAALCTLGHLGTLRLGGKAPLWTLGTEYPIGGCTAAITSTASCMPGWCAMRPSLTRAAAGICHCSAWPPLPPSPPSPAALAACQVPRWWRCTALAWQPCGSRCLPPKSWACCSSLAC